MGLAAAELAKISWGANLDVITRRAIVAFGQKFNLDTATEIYVLGANVYVNGAFYLRRLSEMVEAGKIVYAVADMIHKDPRLELLATAPEASEIKNWAIKERDRRTMERIKYDVDDAAISACVARILPKGIAEEIVGVKAIYDTKNANSGKLLDPVGNASPMETVETRAFRRAMRKLASHVPAMADDVEKMEAAAAVLSRSVQDFRDRQDELGLSEEPDTPLQIGGTDVTIKAGGGGKMLASQGDDLPLQPGEIRYVGADGISVTRQATPEELASTPLAAGQPVAPEPLHDVGCTCPMAPAIHLPTCWRSQLDPRATAKPLGEPAPLHTKKTEAARKAKLEAREPGDEDDDANS
jgi:hypothetical protein